MNSTGWRFHGYPKPADRRTKVRGRTQRGAFEALESRHLLSLPPGPGVPGDANDDYVVDIFDVNVISDQWGTPGPAGDVNFDGIVDIFDVNEVSNRWSSAAENFTPASLDMTRIWYDAAFPRAVTRHGAADFEASQNQFLQSPSLGLASPTTQLSVTFWLNLKSIAPGQSIVGQYDYPSDGSWAIHTGSGTTTQDELWIWTPTAANQPNVPYATTYGADLKANVWYQVTMVFDGTQTGNANRLKIYINGVQHPLEFIGSSSFPPCPADVNHDSKVDIFDINVVSDNWGGSTVGDANGDGAVDIFDINMISENWNIPPPFLNPNGDQIPAVLRQSNAPIYVGRIGGAIGPALDGSLDSLGIFTAALTPAQVQTLFNVGLGQEFADLSAQQKSALRAWWDLDEAAGAVRVAATGQGFNLADHNGVGLRQVASQWRANGGAPALERSYAERPDYVPNAINGLGAVYFDGVNDSLHALTDGAPGDRAGTVFMVVQFAEGALFRWDTIFSSADEDNSSRYLFFSAVTIDPVTNQYSPEGEPRFRIRWRYDDLNVTEVTTDTIEAGVPYLISVSTPGPTGGYRLRINGLNQTIVGTPLPPNPLLDGSWYGSIPGRDNLVMGAMERQSGVDGTGNLLIGEVIVLGEGVTDAENSQVEQYLAEKWDISLSAGGAADLRVAVNVVEQSMSSGYSVRTTNVSSDIGLWQFRSDVGVSPLDIRFDMNSDVRPPAISAKLSESGRVRLQAVDRAVAEVAEADSRERIRDDWRSSRSARAASLRSAVANKVSVDAALANRSDRHFH